MSTKRSTQLVLLKNTKIKPDSLKPVAFSPPKDS